MKGDEYVPELKDIRDLRDMSPSAIQKRLGLKGAPLRKLDHARRVELARRDGGTPLGRVLLPEDIM